LLRGASTSITILSPWPGNPCLGLLCDGVGAVSSQCPGITGADDPVRVFGPMPMGPCRGALVSTLPGRFSLGLTALPRLPYRMGARRQAGSCFFRKTTGGRRAFRPVCATGGDGWRTGSASREAYPGTALVTHRKGSTAAWAGRRVFQVVEVHLQQAPARVGG